MLFHKYGMRPTPENPSTLKPFSTNSFESVALLQNLICPPCQSAGEGEYVYGAVSVVRVGATLAVALHDAPLPYIVHRCPISFGMA